ncbi:hypothetical protein I601_2104 [Nocardioides dokdonensis FR1436]|uniref:DUF4386 domain-containing protein n=1 Tax=Nocardioides dokdonensis FR1436 TaxID=1300347 RepID=A0A1A9GLJ2_9ACTN|nr:DUF4386 family protein [Nocardioides dokdonensis]ANH38532.1 hypothetical protein I601_2104 [Nocardioides dokdonensis FR1436]
MADDRVTPHTDAPQWRGLLVTGGWCAFAVVAMIVVEVGRYLLWPPPTSTAGFYALLLDHPVLGLVSLDLLFIVSNTLTFLVYVALGLALWRVSRSAVVVALAFAVVGTAAFMSSTRPVEMLTLATTYADADEAERTALLATGDGMLATWQGTGYVVYYYLGFATLLILSVLMLRSAVFSRATGAWGLASAVLMVVPATFGQVGLVLAVVSLAPWSVFAVLVGRRLLHLSRPAETTHRAVRPGRAHS